MLGTFHTYYRFAIQIVIDGNALLRTLRLLHCHRTLDAASVRPHMRLELSKYHQGVCSSWTLASEVIIRRYEAKETHLENRLIKLHKLSCTPTL